jgi:hypothetical protein
MSGSAVHMDVYEKSCLFYICTGYELCEADVNLFDSALNNQQLTGTMSSLIANYDDHPGKFVNEAEFRCYLILLRAHSVRIFC